MKIGITCYRLVKWTEYEDQYQDAVEWLAQTEGTVQTFNRLQNTLAEKRDILEQFQNHLQAVFDWQKDLDRLNMRAQQLLETCADSRVSNAVTSITTKYNALLSLAKEIMRRLEVHFQEHQQHSALFQECQEWIERTKEKVVESSGSGGSDNLSELKGRLHQIKCIRQSLEQGHHKLRYIQELKERVILNTEQSGAQQIQDNTDVIRADFDKLSRDVQEARESLSARISILEDIDKAHQMFVDWLQEIMDKVPSPVNAQGAEGLTDLSDKKSALEKYKVLLHDALSHADVLQRLQDKLAAQPDLPREEYDSSIERYEQLKATIQKTISTMEELVQQHEEYRQGYVDAADWIRRTRLDIQQYGDFNGERDAVEEKLRKCCELRQTYPAGEQLVDKAVKLSDVVITGSSTEGQEAIKQELVQLRNEWESLVSSSDETLKSLSDCCSAWSDFQDVFQRMKKWLTEFQAKWLEESTHDTTEEAVESRLVRCRELLKEGESQKSWLEDLNDRCEILMELSTCSRVREETVQLQAGFTTVMGNVQSLLSRLEKTRTDHTDFVTSKAEFANWLERAQGTVQDCSGQCGSEASTKEKYELVRSIASRLTEGQHLMNGMMDSFTKALSASRPQSNPDEQQKGFRAEISTLRANWDQLNIDVNSTLSHLKGVINRWEEFRDACIRMDQWLVTNEQVLSDYPQSKGEVGEMKTLMERLKSQQMEFERKKADLDHLRREASELSASANDHNCTATVDQLHDRWEKLAAVAANYHTRLEEEIQEYNAYHQALQDTEKWILQTSFHLMAHNSMYITTRDQTEEQTKKHNVLSSSILELRMSFSLFIITTIFYPSCRICWQKYIRTKALWMTSGAKARDKLFATQLPMLPLRA